MENWGALNSLTLHNAIPIDRLYASAARHFGERTCGVLLTGAGADGTKGLRTIKEAGGLTIAQETTGCPFPNLVENALPEDLVDAVLSTPQIASRLNACSHYLAPYEKRQCKTGNDLEDIFVHRLGEICPFFCRFSFRFPLPLLVAFFRLEATLCHMPCQNPSPRNRGTATPLPL